MNFFDSIDDDDDNWIHNIFDGIGDNRSSSPVSSFTNDDSAYASSPDNLTGFKNERNIGPINFDVGNCKYGEGSFQNIYCHDYSTARIERNDVFSGPSIGVRCPVGESRNLKINGDCRNLNINRESQNLKIPTARTPILENFPPDGVLDSEGSVCLNTLTDDVIIFEDYKSTGGAELADVYWTGDILTGDILSGAADSFVDEGEGKLEFKFEDNTVTDVLSDISDFYRLCPELAREEAQISKESLLRRRKPDVRKPARKKAGSVKTEYTDGGYYGYSEESEDCIGRDAHGSWLRNGVVDRHASNQRFTLTEALFAYPPLKEGAVILTDEEKRSLLEEGVTFPLTLPLRSQDAKMLKKIRRKIKNRMAAQESRRKQKEYLEMMESRMEIMKQENNQLKEKLNFVESTNRTLNAQIENYQNVIRFSGFTKNKTCLMVLVILFAVSMGTWSPSSLSLGRVLISQNDVLAGLGPYLPSPEKRVGEARLIGPDVVQPSVQYYFQVQDQWKDLIKEETKKQDFYNQPLIPSQEFCFGNIISYIRSYKSWNPGNILQDGEK